MTDDIIVDRTGPHLTLTLNNPARSNALNPAMVEALIAALSDADDVRSCIVQGAGRNFCAGFDLSDIADLSDGDLLHRFLRIETLLQMVYHARFPVMALCQGHVIGAGADLVAACWKRVAAPDATFKMPGWNFELALGTRRLSRLVGAENARDVLIDTRSFGAIEAHAMGLISQVEAQGNWATHVELFQNRGTMLPKNSAAAMFELTQTDTRAEDIAAIVATAGRPGLKDRITAYGTSVAKARATKKAS